MIGRRALIGRLTASYWGSVRSRMAPSQEAELVGGKVEVAGQSPKLSRAPMPALAIAVSDVGM